MIRDWMTTWKKKQCIGTIWHVRNAGDYWCNPQRS